MGICRPLLLLGFTLYAPFPLKVLKVECEVCPHSSSMLLSPKKAPSMSLVMPFLCIFSDLSESIPLNVRLSTILILLRFISLQGGRESVYFNHVHSYTKAGPLEYFWTGFTVNSTEYFSLSCYNRMKIHRFVCKLSATFLISDFSFTLKTHHMILTGTEAAEV